MISRKLEKQCKKKVEGWRKDACFFSHKLNRTLIIFHEACFCGSEVIPEVISIMNNHQHPHTKDTLPVPCLRKFILMAPFCSTKFQPLFSFSASLPLLFLFSIPKNPLQLLIGLLTNSLFPTSVYLPLRVVWWWTFFSGVMRKLMKWQQRVLKSCYFANQKHKKKH